MLPGVPTKSGRPLQPLGHPQLLHVRCNMLSTKADLFPLEFFQSPTRGLLVSAHQTSAEVNILLDEPAASTDDALSYLLLPQIQYHTRFGNQGYNLFPLLKCAHMKAAGLQQLHSETLVSVARRDQKSSCTIRYNPTPQTSHRAAAQLQTSA